MSRSLLLRLFPRRGLRKDDVLLASFPKSGNSWVRFLWANIVALEELDGREMDFHALEGHYGSEYDTLSYGATRFASLPRLVKTHRKYHRRAFGGNRSIYAYRHPGDVMLSYFEFLRARPSERENVPRDMAAFLRHEQFGMPAWCRHVRAWLDEATTMLGYEELQADAAGAMGRVLADLGIETVSEATLREAARRSSFSRLRQIEEKHGRPRQDEFDPEFRFMRSGRAGGWRDRLNPDDALYVQETVRGFGLAALLARDADDAAESRTNTRT